METWNKQVKFVQKDTSAIERTKILDYLSRDAKEKLPELEKTEDEKKCIAAMNNAVQVLLCRLGIDPILVKEDDIHIVDPKEFEEKKGSCFTDNTQDVAVKTAGFEFYQNVYIPRADKHLEWQFVSKLAHEVGHYIARQHMHIEQAVTGEKDDVGRDIVQLKTFLKRKGIGIEKTDRKKYGTGMDEAITELLGLELRRLLDYSDIGFQFSEKQKDDLQKNENAYYEQISVIFDLIDLIDSDDCEGVLYDFFRYYVKGDTKIFERIHSTLSNKGNKKGIKILFSMTTDPKDALRVADALHLENAIEEINQLLACDEE